MVEVPIAEHAPGSPAHAAEQRVLRPGAAPSPRGKLLDQSFDRCQIRSPRSRPCGENLGRSRDPSLWPRQPVEHGLPYEGSAQRAWHRSARELPQREAHLVAKMREHLRSRHPAPLRGSVRSELVEPAEQAAAATPIENGAHRLCPPIPALATPKSATTRPPACRCISAAMDDHPAPDHWRPPNVRPPRQTRQYSASGGILANRCRPVILPRGELPSAGPYCD